MSSQTSRELILEIQRLLSLPKDARESEGIYASESQLKLLLKRVRTSRNSLPAGIAKFVSDFSSSSSRLLQLIDSLDET
jgi:hypothetical protein